MAECRDCDAPEIASIPPRGDGKCRHCHGTGKEQGFERWGTDFLGLEASDCDVCGGSGDCQTCDGTGEVDDEDED